MTFTQFVLGAAAVALFVIAFEIRELAERIGGVDNALGKLCERVGRLGEVADQIVDPALGLMVSNKGSIDIDDTSPIKVALSSPVTLQAEKGLPIQVAASNPPALAKAAEGVDGKRRGR